MCGIIGYIGSRQAQPILLDGLSHLEYRGYDSSGVAVMDHDCIIVRKSAGRLDNLSRMLDQQSLTGVCGIGHTRWATHGEPSDKNAHPHQDASGKIVIVHNGIIENHRLLRNQLMQEGVHFISDTDTEVIAHLLAKLYQGDMRQTLLRVQHMLEGSYALCVLSADEPEQIFCMRHDSPLVIGAGQGEQFVASDIPALLPYTQDMIFLQDGDVAVLSASSVRLYSRHGDPLPLVPAHIDWSIESAEKGGFDYFMLKEIHEQPAALTKTLHAHADMTRSAILASVFPLTHEEAASVRRIVMTACGTAYHACMAGKYILESLTRIPVDVDIASEFRYRKPILDESCLCIALSQSGETADTLAALREAGTSGAKTLCITNVVGSSITRLPDCRVLYTHAGPEIAVASTKAYITQVEVLLLFSISLAVHIGKLPPVQAACMLASIDTLSKKARAVLSLADEIKAFASRFSSVQHVFFIGRGLDYAIAMEASLKLKEVSYVFSEAYAAGELKHGTIALVETGTLVFAIATQPLLVDKLRSNIHEIRSRGASTVVITTDALRSYFIDEADVLWCIPDLEPLMAPLLAVIPTQLFACYMAISRGCDVDKPRNLAKSVTVE